MAAHMMTNVVGFETNITVMMYERDLPWSVLPLVIAAMQALITPQLG